MLPSEELSGFLSPLFPFHLLPFVFTLRYLLWLKRVNFKLKTDKFELDNWDVFPSKI